MYGQRWEASEVFQNVDMRIDEDASLARGSQTVACGPKVARKDV